MTNQDHSRFYVDEHVVRIVGAQVVLLTGVAIFSHSQLVILLLALDFALRAFTTLSSPLALVAKLIVRKAGLKPKVIFAPPKKFAALLGFLFAVSLFILSFTELTLLYYLIAVLLLVCALLESVFSICLGCYVYNWFVAPVINKRNSLK